MCIFKYVQLCITNKDINAESDHLNPAVAQPVGAWTVSRRVAGSSPQTDLKYGVWTATWRGPSSPPALPWCP